MLAAVPDTSISGKRVAHELTMIVGARGKPQMIVSDNGTDFTSNAMSSGRRIMVSIGTISRQAD
jgi:transposase InsO family protein